jgi:hypothetical protein
VPGNTGEAGPAFLPKPNDLLNSPGTAIQLVEARDGVGLVQVQYVAVEQPACGVELIEYAIGIRPKRLPGNEHF